MSLYDVNTKQFVFAYLKECVSQYYIYTYIDIWVFFFKNPWSSQFDLVWPAFALLGTKSQGPQKKLTNIILVVAFFAASIGIAF